MRTCRDVRSKAKHATKQTGRHLGTRGTNTTVTTEQHHASLWVIVGGTSDADAPGISRAEGMAADREAGAGVTYTGVAVSVGCGDISNAALSICAKNHVHVIGTLCNFTACQGVTYNQNQRTQT
jgi:hypothetical protein